MTQELAQSLNMNEKELADYVNTIGRVLCENFIKDVWNKKITLQEAFRKSVELWDKKHTDMCMQLMVGRRGADKLKLFSDAILDDVYEGLNR